MELTNNLQSESEVIIICFKNIKMIVNTDKFQSTILDKQKIDHSNEIITFNNKTVEVCIFYQPLWYSIRLQT